ncbi:haloalkane dehalogenase [Euzebya rosea]|uniref:haloalkane dehalogenase n=1 Tax=Euzebya rosea TaxID=2052804 RepID=UPI000D3EC85D|nr:haloalkane dehalogenase [Euzebya rosea]
MELLTTPADRFDDLPDWPYASQRVDVGHGAHMAFVDEGPRDAAPILLLHGEPTWSYLYRHMIPGLLEAGHRVVAPDLIGFGRSDKPADRADHSFAGHVEWMSTFVAEVLDLTGITLFCQDWGGLIGLRVVAEHPERFARLVIGNSGLPTGDQEMPEAFMRWQHFSQTVESFPVSPMIQGATNRELTPAELAAYDAPFPSEAYKEGPRIMPSLVPTSPDNPASAANRRAWEVLMAFERPVLTTFSDNDPITGGGDRVFQKLVPGTKGQDHTTVSGGHFLQEDAGPELAAIITRFVAATS